MLVFVDESGDSGRKFGKGSSTYLLVTAVLFADLDEASECDRAIGDLRQACGIPANAEFHFNKTSNLVRQRFLEGVARYKFSFLSFGLNKPLIAEPDLQSKESLVRRASQSMFEDAKPHLRGATVVIDGSSSKEFRSQLSAYLKQRINPAEGDQHIKRVKIQDSKKNNLIQLADMVCGAVYRSVDRGEHEFRKLIKPRELQVRIWP